MKGVGVTFVLCAVIAAGSNGQSVLPVKAAAQKTSLQSTNAPQVTVTPLDESLTLTGIINLPSYQRAFLKIETPGQPSRYQALAPNAHSGEVILLSINSQKNTVTVRHRGNVRELWLNTRTSERATPSAMELVRDASHSAHHTRRAQLDREREEAEESQIR
jgi:hypothetical protein